MKYFFTVALALGALTAQAQQGSLYIGGQAGFNSSTTEFDNGSTTTTTGKRSNYSFSPEIGTFLTNQVQLGVGFTFSGSKQENPGDLGNYGSRTNRFGGTVYTRYFFGEGNFRPFLGLNASVLPGNRTDESNGVAGITETKYNTLDLGANLNAGFAYGLNTRWTVVGSFGTLGFQRSSSKQENTDVKTTTTDFGLNVNTLGNLFTVGVYYTFKPAAQ